LQPSTRQALEAYLATRARHAPRAMTCSSPSGGEHRTRCAPTSCSSGWPGSSDTADQPERPGCGSTICGTLSPCVRLSPARATGKPSHTTWPAQRLSGARVGRQHVLVSRGHSGAAARYRCRQRATLPGEAA
jgi:hypothetical protein